MSRSNIIAYVSLSILIMVLAVLLYKKPKEVMISNQEQTYKDSLILLKKQVDISHQVQAKLKYQYDSLSTLEQPILYRTHEKISFILTTATPQQLDSIISNSLKRKLRYH